MILSKRLICHIVLISMIFLLIGSCATYYAQNLRMQQFILDGYIKEADNLLEADKKTPEGKNRILHYLNRGVVSQMLKEYTKSNRFFATADSIIEVQYRKLGNEVLALITNPTVKPYKPEDFEVVLLNYYMAINYLQLGQYDEAIVECKRINIKLNELNDKYKDNKNHYQKDAFANNLMGIIYEANKDYNNAFIAYRNAYEIYNNDYLIYFNMRVPGQLKEDILRTAYLTGFHDEVAYYEKLFNIKYEPQQQNNNGELVFFWLNGLVPVKSEWSINFTKLPGKSGFVTFVNDEYGLSFPIYIGDKSDKQKSAFEQLRFVRVAFPKYLERSPFYSQAKLVINQESHAMELAEDINEIAFKTLHDRMIREIANSIMRLATKKALEAAFDDALGTIVSIANAVTEKADTRNWQTLPYSISYARILLPEGENPARFVVSNNNTSREYSFSFNIQKGQMKFFTFHNLESLPLKSR